VSAPAAIRPGAWAAALAALEGGAISPSIAMARLLLSGDPPTPDRLDALAAAEPVFAGLAELGRAQADGLQRLAGIAAAGIDPEGEDMVAATAALFDRMAAASPEAAVAFYSLGDPALLDRATAELAGVVRDWAPVAGRDMVDLGCGIGRLAAALASEAASVVAIDVSAAMVAEAERRTGPLGVRVVQGSGRDLAVLGDASCDLLVAADSFPYLVRAGLADGHVAEAARVLRPGGDLMVFNWSYRGDDAADLADARALAAQHGFAVVRAGERPFAIWDGTGFHLRRTA